MKWMGIAWLAALVSSAGAAGSGPDATIDFGGLLDEMVDRTALARYPSPRYTCRQFSSYDRASVSPADAEGWFANGDRGQYLRVEENAGRQEWVMMDAPGPGAVVRIWSANPQGNLRIYLDGADTPALEAPMADLLGGTWRIAPPLSATRSRGWNLYLPVPYAERCKITSDQGDFYYQVNYRTYAPGTKVASFSLAALDAEEERLARVQEKLAFADTSYPRKWSSHTIGAGQTHSSAFPPRNPSAIRDITVKVEHADLEQALRTTVLELVFDGESTVWCPVGDFFGTGAGLQPSSDWWRTVREDGSMNCRWIMPYQKTAEIRFHNLGATPVVVRYGVFSESWAWDADSMYFHAAWRQEDPIHTRPMHDWNYVEVQGRGVYAGDNLAVANPVEDWWGEGDEKIWVDGEAFPSHIGTGTEDYYGYAWCCPEPFRAPFHGQPRCDGPGNYGHTLVSRVRSLDGIPFERSFRFDIEVWHWAVTDVGYAATACFYARPGAVVNRGPAPAEAARGLLHPAPLPPPFAIEGAVECEKMAIVGQTAGIAVGAQGGFAPGLWSGEQQLWIQGLRPGDFVELFVPVETGGRYRVEVFATRSCDYGLVLFSIDGKPTGLGADLFNLAGQEVAATGPLDLGVHEVTGGGLVLRAEVAGGNPASSGTRSFFGLDCVRLTPVEGSGG
ncbi:MAG: glycoside hydrolase family 172 protein [Planctomycetota bacterium]